MRVLVDDDAGLKIAVAVRLLSVPDVHAHPRARTVGRCGEVRVLRIAR